MEMCGLDREWGVNHPELGAKTAGSLSGKAYYDIVLLHSRRLAKKLGATTSKLG
jgi:hypothetical protein